MAQNIQLIVNNLGGRDTVEYDVVAQYYTFTAAGTNADPTIDVKAVTMTRVADNATQWQGEAATAASLNDSYGVIEVIAVRAAGAAELSAAAGLQPHRMVARSAARFQVDGTKGMTLYFDAATGRWTGNELVDDEVEVSVTNGMSARRFVSVTDAGQTLVQSSLASGASGKVWYRPFGADATPVMEHAALPAVFTDGHALSQHQSVNQEAQDSRFLNAPLSGSAQVTLALDDSDVDDIAKDVHGLHGMVTALLVLIAIMALISFSHAGAHMHSMFMGSKASSARRL